jgi:hypothetical protein
MQQLLREIANRLFVLVETLSIVIAKSESRWLLAGKGYKIRLVIDGLAGQFEGNGLCLGRSPVGAVEATHPLVNLGFA